MKLKNLDQLIAATSRRDNQAAIRAIFKLLETEDKPAWIHELSKLAEFLADGEPRFSIFAKGGNSKLPFVAFSAMPGDGFCPGAGDCKSFCYSFRAWRYPAAFCRQVQNTFLLNDNLGRFRIEAALDKFEKRATAENPIDFRLYVDGDFRDVADVEFWMGAIMGRPWIRAYGYSKSFNELLSYQYLVDGRGYEWPTNYLLNISGGHLHDADTVSLVKQLPITRGEFIAVPVDHKVTSKDHGTSKHNKVLRATFGRKAFTCPGKCGECTPGGHACGSDRFRNVDIIIAVH
jgi:hypothetical protein